MKFCKILSLVMVFAMLAAVCSCTTTPSTTSTKTPSTTSTNDPADSNRKYTVGICQLAQHPALDAATEGFKKALKDKLGDNVVFDEQNASNDSNTCATIVNAFVTKKVDLIMANATPALQAAANATTTIPILGTSVTEYGVALGIKDFSGTVGTNVSGTSDLAPLDKQADMILELVPNAKKVSIIYCSAEDNSLYQVNVIKEALEAKGVTATAYSFSDTNDMAAVCESACTSDTDAIYVPTDNSVASSTGILHAIAKEKNIPVIAGEEGIMQGCGIASLTISYYDIGYQTGIMAYQVLTGEADISTLAIAYAPQFTKKYNPTICEELGITVPSDYVASEASN